MVECKCINKIRDKYNNIQAYVLMDTQGISITMDSSRLKEAIFLKQINVKNLKMTTDGKLIDSKEDNSNKRTDTITKDNKTIIAGRASCEGIYFSEYMTFRKYENEINEMAEIFFNAWDIGLKQLSKKDTYRINSLVNSMLIIENVFTLVGYSDTQVCGTLAWEYDTKYFFKFSDSINKFLKEQNPYYGYGIDSSGDKIRDIKSCIITALKLILGNEEMYRDKAIPLYSFDSIILNILNSIKNTIDEKYRNNIYIQRDDYDFSGVLKYKVIYSANHSDERNDTCKFEVNLLELELAFDYKENIYVLNINTACKFNYIVSRNQFAPVITVDTLAYSTITLNNPIKINESDYTNTAENIRISLRKGFNNLTNFAKTSLRVDIINK